MMEDFKFPFKISSSSFKQQWNKKNLINAGTVNFTKSILSSAFLRYQSLEEVSKDMSEQLVNYNGGEWFVFISPAEVESGLALNLHSTVGLTFIRDTLTYAVIIGQTKI